MALEEINKYIETRYERWHDYSAYHCSCAGITDESTDVLNEVLCNLLQKPEEKLRGLYDKKSGQYRELDYFVLRMIKLNATSMTSPYRHKYRSIPVDANIDFTEVDIADENNSDEEYDKSGEILKKTKIVRTIFESLEITQYAKDVFTWRFFCGEKFSEWTGPETEKELFDCYYKVIHLIKDKLNNNTLF